MRLARRTLMVAATAVIASSPSMASAARFMDLSSGSAAGRFASVDPVLMVTFDDAPDEATAAARLDGLGTVSPLAPEAGVWALRDTRAATARRRAMSRPGVQRAEWSTMRSAHALEDPRPVPPPPLPLQVDPEPADPIYVDAARSWHLHTGKWTIGMSHYDRPTIAILDSGLAMTHEEWRAAGLVVFPHTVVPGRTSAEDDLSFGHGTHVTGIAAAPADGIGVVGVAPASATSLDAGVSKVMPVQIAKELQGTGVTTDAWQIAGIRWAVLHGAKVINISYGGEGANEAFTSTINWAFSRGVLIVASVGNEGMPSPFRPVTNPLNFPAGYPHVVGVAAQCDATVDPSVGCDAPFTRARFSNFNRTVDVMAPGVNIPSTIPIFTTLGQFAPGYGLNTGTSMAAPYVAGVAALIYASHPGITPYQVTRILEQTASRAVTGRPRNNKEGWGAVDPLAAVQAQAPVDDLAEPNDDATAKVKAATLRPTKAPVVLQAFADANDDPFDVYAVQLRKGERLKVTIDAQAGALTSFVFRPGIRSFARLSDTQFDAKLLGKARRPTPGARAIVVRAKESGRHWIVVNAELRGSDYTLKIQRLS